MLSYCNRWFALPPRIQLKNGARHEIHKKSTIDGYYILLQVYIGDPEFPDLFVFIFDQVIKFPTIDKIGVIGLPI